MSTERLLKGSRLEFEAGATPPAGGRLGDGTSKMQAWRTRWHRVRQTTRRSEAQSGCQKPAQLRPGPLLHSSTEQRRVHMTAQSERKLSSRQYKPEFDACLEQRPRKCKVWRTGGQRTRRREGESRCEKPGILRPELQLHFVARRSPEPA